MNNQPSTNLEGYLAINKLNIKLIQHCRINPLININLVKTINKRCNSIIAVSNDIYKNLINYGINPNLCTTIYNGIDINQKIISKNKARHILNISKNSFIFGSIGSLILRKSHHHTLQALGLFKKENPNIDWKFFLIGEGPEKQNLKNIAIKQNIAKNVIFTGFLDSPINYLIAFNIFIIASSNEGLPRVILESMLVNTVIIGSNVSGTSELIAHYKTGILFKYGDIFELKKNIEILFHNSYLRNKLTKFANQKLKNNYNIKKYISRIEKLFLKC